MCATHVLFKVPINNAIGDENRNNIINIYSLVGYEFFKSI